jgi:phosphoribosyl-AMP cyclohydrolase / phosphoribosyl-ATP pyrophosphohydrolase
MAQAGAAGRGCSGQVVLSAGHVSTVGTRITVLDLDEVNFAKGDGLLPAVVHYAGTGAVLMLGYMSRAALFATLMRGRVVFFSRSKGRLWEKGETSGHFLELVHVQADCDRDTLLVSAWPRGSVCHSGSGSCFGEVPETPDDPIAFLGRLEQVIGERASRASMGASGTSA